MDSAGATISAKDLAVARQKLRALEARIVIEHQEIRRLRTVYSECREEHIQAVGGLDNLGVDQGDLREKLKTLSSKVTISNSALDAQIKKTEDLEDAIDILQNQIPKPRLTDPQAKSDLFEAALQIAPRGERIVSSSHGESPESASSIHLPPLVQDYFDAVADEKLCEEILYVDLVYEFAEKSQERERLRDQGVITTDDHSLDREYSAKALEYQKKLFDARQLSQRLKHECDIRKLETDTSFYRAQTDAAISEVHGSPPFVKEWLDNVTTSDQLQADSPSSWQRHLTLGEVPEDNLEAFASATPDATSPTQSPRQPSRMTSPIRSVTATGQHTATAVGNAGGFLQARPRFLQSDPSQSSNARPSPQHNQHGSWGHGGDNSNTSLVRNVVPQPPSPIAITSFPSRSIDHILGKPHRNFDWQSASLPPRCAPLPGPDAYEYVHYEHRPNTSSAPNPVSQTSLVTMTGSDAIIQRRPTNQPFYPGQNTFAMVNQKPSQNDNASARSGFTVRKGDKKKFFSLGRVFLASWVEPTGGEYPGTKAYPKIKTFVVIRPGVHDCTALSIVTYQGQGVSKKGVAKADHVVIYTGHQIPAIRADEQPKPNEAGMLETAIQVEADKDSDHLNDMSRLNLVQCFTVYHNIKVKPFGRVARESMQPLQDQFRKVWGIVPDPHTIDNRRNHSQSALSTQLQALRSPVQPDSATYSRTASPSQARSSARGRRPSVGSTSHTTLGTTRLSTSAHRTFRRQNADFFNFGRVFGLPNDAPPVDGSDSVTEVTAVSFAHPERKERVKWFVVLREANDSCSALSVRTYDGQGVSRAGIKKSDHAIIYTGLSPPSELPGERPGRHEDSMQRQPIRVEPEYPGTPLDITSRLNFKKVYNIKHDQLVINFGQVSDMSRASLEYQWRNVFGIGNTSASELQAPSPEDLQPAYHHVPGSSSAIDRSHERNEAGSLHDEDKRPFESYPEPYTPLPV